MIDLRIDVSNFFLSATSLTGDVAMKKDTDLGEKSKSSLPVMLKVTKIIGINNIINNSPMCLCLWAGNFF